jgi:hypothetical protein
MLVSKAVAVAGLIVVLLAVAGCNQPRRDEGMAKPAAALQTANEPYVLPTADGDGPTPSRPTLEGRISIISADRIRVTPQSGEPSVYRLTSDTKLFTVYGGHLDAAELLVGQHVRVWIEPDAPDGSEQRAAVVMLASTDPSDDFQN